MRALRSKRLQGGWWQYLIPAAASVIGGMLSKEGQEDANVQNVELGREQMAFQERMSNTQYQRAVADMRAAGLNPLLAYQQGGSGTPAGSMPRVENAMGAAVSSAASGFQASMGAQQMAANTELTRAQAEKVKSETMAQDLNSARLASEIAAMRAQANRHNVESDKTFHENLGHDMYMDLASAELQERQGRASVSAAQGARESGSWEADVRRRKAEARAAELGLSEQAAMSKFWEKTGSLNPHIKQLLDLLRVFSSARGVLR